MDLKLCLAVVFSSCKLPPPGLCPVLRGHHGWKLLWDPGGQQHCDRLRWPKFDSQRHQDGAQEGYRHHKRCHPPYWPSPHARFRLDANRLLFASCLKCSWAPYLNVSFLCVPSKLNRWWNCWEVLSQPLATWCLSWAFPLQWDQRLSTLCWLPSTVPSRVSLPSCKCICW